MTDSYSPKNRYKRERYRSDPEYRERVLAQQKADREQTYARRKHRYRYDDAYRQKCIERARQYYARKRGEG